MKTMVTGGCGFIGSHLVKRLVDQGREVVVVDNESRGDKDRLLNLGFDRSFIKKNFKEVNFKDLYAPVGCFKDVDTVFHLAARMGGIDTLHGSAEKELDIFAENLRIDANVFQLCRDNNVKKIVYTSSVAVYPTDNTIYREDDFDGSQPDGGYGFAKVMAEYQLNLMKESCDIGIARLFNVYGENNSLDKTAFVIDKFIKQMIREETVIVYDGMQTRSYLYISDCIDALMKLEELAGGLPRLEFNIAHDKFVSINELAKKIKKISGKKAEVKHDFGKPTGPWSRIANIDSAKIHLKWEPKVGLDEGLKRTYKSVEKRLSK